MNSHLCDHDNDSRPLHLLHYQRVAVTCESDKAEFGLSERLRSAERLDAWLKRHDYAAFDPFDGLSSYLRPLAIGKIGRQALQQGVRRFPINLRPMLGIRPARGSKGLAYLARGYLRLHRATGNEEYLDKAKACLSWLEATGSRDYGGISWGNHFDYQSRVFYLPKGTPTIVWVALIGQAFVDAWETVGEARYLDVALDACRFITTGLERREQPGGICFSYIPGEYKAVHNANMLGAALLARVGRITGDTELRVLARQAVDYTVGAQLPDGSWWYGQGNDLRWIDSFHTGYVLDSLRGYIEATKDTRYTNALTSGADFFVNHFFLADGTPKYYPDRTYPIDIQCASQAIETLTWLGRSGSDPTRLALARKVASWTIAKMQDPSGYFYFRRLPLFVNRTATLHWGQATMLHSLATVILDEVEHGN